MQPKGKTTAVTTTHPGRFIKDRWRGTVGRFVMPNDRAAMSWLNNLTKNLVAAGRLTQEEARDVIMDIRAEVERSAQELETRVEQRVRAALQKIRGSRAAEMSRLHRVLDGLEEKIQEIQTLHN